MGLLICDYSKNPYLNNPEAKEIDRHEKTAYEGRLYTKLSYEVKIGASLRAWQVLQAFALTILTCFIALAFEGVRNLWSQGVSGIENVTILTPVIENKMASENPIDSFYKWDVDTFFKALLPIENETSDTSTLEKVEKYFLQALEAGATLSLLPGASLLELGSMIYKYITGNEPPISELEKFQNNPDWNIEIDPTIPLGATISEYQVSGSSNCPHSSWAWWEGLKGRILNGDKSGVVLDFWNKPERILDKMTYMNKNHLRLSVEWSNIQPTKEGGFSKEALNHYVDLVKKMIEEGKEPLITLHHFSDPKWFLDEGGFENESNIQYYIDFAKEVFTTLSPYVKKWVTFNEPTIYAFQGYVRGVYPPGVNSVLRAGNVCKHLMMAHCQVYDALKDLDVSKESSIGIAHQILRFYPYHPHIPLERIVCYYLSQMTHYCVMDFFTKGKFEYQVPFAANVTYSRPDSQSKLDFFGIQYYTNTLISMEISKDIMESTCYPNEKMMKMPFRFFPEGMATALDECRPIKKPVWITETGASALTEADQKEFLEKVLKVASLAKKLGVPVERIYAWTPEDNFEWDMGFEQFFGLFGFNHVTKESFIKEAGEFYRNLPQV